MTSVNRGGQIALFVNTAEPSYKMDVLYRLLRRRGSAAHAQHDHAPGVVQPKCPEQLDTGLIGCDWTAPYVLNIPGTGDPTEWMRGVHLVKLTAGTSGEQQYIMFAVRDDLRPSDLLLAQTVNTSQAYNVWGASRLRDDREPR